MVSLETHFSRDTVALDYIGNMKQCEEYSLAELLKIEMSLHCEKSFGGFRCM